MAGNLLNRIYRGSGAGREGSYLNPTGSVDPGFDPGLSDESIYGPQTVGLSAREFARTFDPTSNEDVFKMQGMLGLQEDGILGPKTLAALRNLQGGNTLEGIDTLDREDAAGLTDMPPSVWSRIVGGLAGGKAAQKWKDSMTDDEGWFQGGREGRMFGRARDYAEDSGLGGMLGKLLG